LAAAAEQTWRLALDLAPEDTRVMGNLVALLQAQGRPEAAQPVQARLARLQSLAPFAHYREGLLAARAGNWPRTRDEMQQEIDRNPNFLEAQAWLAQAYLALGDLPDGATCSAPPSWATPRRPLALRGQAGPAEPGLSP
jgi:Tfp pilus assembly protein PilF